MLTSLPRLRGALAAALMLVSCGLNPVDVTEDGEGTTKADESTATSETLTTGSRVHLFPKISEGNARVSPTLSAHLTYYGGKVIPNVKAYSVNWGSAVNSRIQTGMPNFYAAFGASNMFTWLGAEYSTVGLNGQDGQPGSDQTLGAGSSGGSFTITPSTTSKTLTDAQIQAEISAQIAAGKLPAADDNAYYGINFPKGITITDQGSSSCVQFCAYHGTFKRGSQNVYYGVLPSVESGSGCETGCGSNSDFFNNATSVASHELIEAVTDAEVGLGTTVTRPLAWYDATNGEIGDICNASQGTITDAAGTSWVIQKEFDNATSTCIATKSVSSDFTIAVTPASGTVAQGSTASFTVKTTNVAGSPSIALSATGLPSGVTGAFSPATVTAGGSSTFTVTASASAATGTASVSIKGTASASSHSASASLTVTSSGSGGGAGGGTGGGAGGGGGGGTTDPALAIGTPIANLAGASGSTSFWQITVPAGLTSLKVAITGSSASSNDADLYVRAGSHPTTTTYDCRPYKTGSNESCTFNKPAAGTYSVMLRGYTAYSGVTLSAK